MKYFKNTELAKLYHVSEKSVRNWIEAAETGKLDLQLFEKNGKNYIANLSKNTLLIEKLVERGKKFKNTRGHKEITPSDQFYKLYDQNQIFQIVSSLNVHRELPLQYNYFAAGAKDWNAYAERLDHEAGSNMLNACKALLTANLANIERLIGSRKRVNIIDIGIGNCLPVKEFLAHFIEKKMLNRYIGLDISGPMLKIAEKNLHDWFGDKAIFEFHERDMTRDTFDDLIASDYFEGEEPPVNIVLLLGGTLNNFEVPDDVLRLIYKSIQPSDIFVFSLKLDTPNSRRYFDLNSDPSQVGQLATWQSTTLRLLNIDESFFEIEQIYHPEKRARFISARLLRDISITFNLNKGKHVISLHKDESILMLRYRHHSDMDILNLFHRNGFDTLQTSKSRDQEYFLIVSELGRHPLH